MADVIIRIEDGYAKIESSMYGLDVRLIIDDCEIECFQKHPDALDIGFPARITCIDDIIGDYDNRAMSDMTLLEKYRQALQQSEAYELLHQHAEIIRDEIARADDTIAETALENIGKISEFAAIKGDYENPAYDNE